MKKKLLAACIFGIACGSVKAQTLQLTASDYNGFSVSCNGEEDGSIDLAVTRAERLHTRFNGAMRKQRKT